VDKSDLVVEQRLDEFPVGADPVGLPVEVGTGRRHRPRLVDKIRQFADPHSEGSPAAAGRRRKLKQVESRKNANQICGTFAHDQDQKVIPSRQDAGNSFFLVTLFCPQELNAARLFSVGERLYPGEAYASDQKSGQVWVRPTRASRKWKIPQNQEIEEAMSGVLESDNPNGNSEPRINSDLQSLANAGGDGGFLPEDREIHSDTDILPGRRNLRFGEQR
jgi:hypothetical protein